MRSRSLKKGLDIRHNCVSLHVRRIKRTLGLIINNRKPVMTTKRKRPSNPLSENIAVPNGTTIANAHASDETPLASINEPVVSYIERFKSFGKASAEGIIEQCRTIVLAEDDLAPRYFKRFCD